MMFQYPRNLGTRLDVADRFDCKGLKLAADAELAASDITVATAADLVLFADAKNCPLLKEAAMDFSPSNPTSVMSSSGWANMRELVGLLAELLEVAFSKKKISTPADESYERDYKHMCVSSLRQKLDERGLDVEWLPRDAYQPPGGRRKRGRSRKVIPGG
jgi:hypothetical protein